MTGLASGERVSKNHKLTIACGELDELMASIGVAQSSLIELAARNNSKEETIYKSQLGILQKIVFDCGTDLTTSVFNKKRFTRKGRELPQNGTHMKLNESYLVYIERLIDTLSEDLEDLHSFIMPIGETTVTQLHTTRAVCRRAERSLSELDEVNAEVSKVINRLSDLFFVMARHVNCVLLNAQEAVYDPKESAIPPVLEKDNQDERVKF